MKLLTVLFFCAMYYLVKTMLELFDGDKGICSIDNNKLTCDVLNGVSLDERKLRMANGYYNK